VYNNKAAFDERKTVWPLEKDALLVTSKKDALIVVPLAKSFFSSNSVVPFNLLIQIVGLIFSSIYS
jgi:hypothetical protein